jgi:hypothetical protein
VVVVAVKNHVDQPAVEVRKVKPKPLHGIDLGGALKPLSIQRSLVPESFSDRRCEGELEKEAEERTQEVHPGKLANARISFVEGLHKAVEDEAVTDVEESLQPEDQEKRWLGRVPQDAYVD